MITAIAFPWIYYDSFLFNNYYRLSSASSLMSSNILVISSILYFLIIVVSTDLWMVSLNFLVLSSIYFHSASLSSYISLLLWSISFFFSSQSFWNYFSVDGFFKCKYFMILFIEISYSLSFSFLFFSSKTTFSLLFILY